jgi:hypothetical protein
MARKAKLRIEGEYAGVPMGFVGRVIWVILERASINGGVATSGRSMVCDFGRGCDGAQHAFSRPKIRLLERALAGQLWKTRPAASERAPQFAAFWITAHSKFRKCAPKSWSREGSFTLDRSAQ